MSEEDDLNLIKRTIPDVASTVRIPLLSEVSLTITAIIIAFSGVAAAVAALLARAPILVIFIRTGVTILVVGLLGFVINWLIARYLIVSTVEKFSEELAGRSSEELETQA